MLTGETGAGKSIILDALGLAPGARGRRRPGAPGRGPGLGHRRLRPAARPSRLGPDLEDKGLASRRARTWSCAAPLAADGRSRAFVNDQPTGVGVLKELGEALLEVHGQHETVGLLDARTHRAAAGRLRRLRPQLAGVAGAAWRAWREARDAAEALRGRRRPRRRRDRGTDPAPRRTGPAGPRARARRRNWPRNAPSWARRKRRSADIAAARDAAGRRRPVRQAGRRLRALEHARERAVQAGRRRRGTAVRAAGRRRRGHRPGPGRGRRGRSPPSTPPPTPSTSSPTGWTRPRSGCSPCAPLPAS